MLCSQWKGALKFPCLLCLFQKTQNRDVLNLLMQHRGQNRGQRWPFPVLVWGYASNGPGFYLEHRERWRGTKPRSASFCAPLEILQRVKTGRRQPRLWWSGWSLVMQSRCSVFCQTGASSSRAPSGKHTLPHRKHFRVVLWFQKMILGIASFLKMELAWASSKFRRGVYTQSIFPRRRNCCCPVQLPWGQSS